jgi:ribosomal protein L21E
MQLNAAVLAPAFEESTEERGAATASDVEAIIDDASFQSREGHNRFEGGTGRLLGLDRSIYEGMIGIALLVADGWSTKEIAARLDRSHH